ncbi:putative reverse transcriptase zinc-binding domain-containing protein [Helianthus anomalus]
MGGFGNGDRRPMVLFPSNKFGIDIESSNGVEEPNLKFCAWNNWAPPKVNFLVWRALLGKIASKVGLARRGVPLSDVSCSRCGIAEENPDHLFVNCLWARSIWWNVLSWMRIAFPMDLSSLGDFVSYV